MIYDHMSKPKKDIFSDACSSDKFSSEASASEELLSESSFEIALSPSGKPKRLDAYIWEFIIQHLILKASQYPCKGNIQVNIREKKDQIEVDVLDAGTGIPMAELNNSIPRQLTIAASRREGFGTGLGVSILTELLDVYEGVVKSDKKVKKNAMISITLLKQDKHLQQDRIIERDESISNGYYVSDGMPGRITNEVSEDIEEDLLRREKVLVVDDNPKMNDYVSYMLSSSYNVLSAYDGRTAYETILSTQPDLIVSDIMMPVMNGYDLLDMVKENKLLSNIPIILLSARAGAASVAESIKKGADDYLVKPFSDVELLTRVKTQLELARSRRLIQSQEARLQKREIDQKDKFISIASHELKTPLTSLLAYTELLTEKAASLDKSTLQSYLNKSSTFVKRLNNLVSELVDVSRIKKGNLEYTFSAFDFPEMINESVENVRSVSPAHSFDVGGTMPDTYIGDRYRLQQVIHNLLINAVKYSPNGGLITLNCTQEPGRIIVSVRDQGIGIPKEAMKEIFKSYGRAKTRYQISGLGIGLFICTNIIERHSGKIWVESEVDKGSVFYFSLPMKTYE